MVKFKDFSRPLIVFQGLFKLNLIFKDFSSESCLFKYFSSLCETCVRIIELHIHNGFEQYTSPSDELGGHKSPRS